MGWEVYGHVRLYLMLCCVRALGGGAGFGPVGEAGWELTFASCGSQAGRSTASVGRCYCQACEIEERLPQTEALTLFL